MGKTWKIVLGLALALPMLAYVAGSLVAAGDEPGDRTPIEFVENPSPSGGTPEGTQRVPEGKKGTEKGNKPGTKQPKPGPDRTTPPSQPEKPEVIHPAPRDLDDDDDDGGDDDDGAGDDDD